MTQYKSFKTALQEVATYKKSDLDKYKSFATALDEVKNSSVIITSDNPQPEEKKKKKPKPPETAYTDHSPNVTPVKEHKIFAQTALTKLSESFIWRKNAGTIADQLLEMLNDGTLTTEQPMNECILAAYESLKTRGKLK